MSIDNPVLFHEPIAGTPFQGLILHNTLAICAYIGVPSEHCLAGMEKLHFECAEDITYRDYGDGFFRPSGFFWYGWIYDMPINAEQMFGPDFFGADVPPELVQHFKTLNEGKKRWTEQEIQCDLIDAAMSLQEVLARYESTSLDVIAKASRGQSMQSLRDEAHASNAQVDARKEEDLDGESE